MDVPGLAANALGLSAAQLESSGAQWTARELLQQPHIWAETEALIGAQRAALSAFLDPLLGQAGLRILLTGAGTSAYIGECLAPALARSRSLCVDAIATTDLVASPDSYLSPEVPTLLISFARSGNSPESVAALEIADARLKRCWHLIFTCDGAGALYRRAASAPRTHAVLLPEDSNDRGFAMTSSFSGMLLAAALTLRLLPTHAGAAAVRAALAAEVLPGRLQLLQTLVEQKFERAVYLGSRELKGLARESALKMLELTDGKVVAIADTPLGFRHGPKTIINPATLIVVFVSSDDYTRQYDLDLLRELRRDGIAARVVALTASASGDGDRDELVLSGPGDGGVRPDLELCLPYAMFAQSLALLRSISLQVRPDNPSAAGTVSRVVKGVSIHPWRNGA